MHIDLQSRKEHVCNHISWNCFVDNKGVKNGESDLFDSEKFLFPRGPGKFSTVVPARRSQASQLEKQGPQTFRFAAPSRLAVLQFR